MRTEMTRVVLAVTLAAVGANCASTGQRQKYMSGQSAQSFETEIIKTVKAQYLLSLPTGYAKSNRSWPLMLFLHGAGERGDDLKKVEIHGPPKLIAREGKELPFVVVSPQCPDDGWWSDEAQIEMLNALLDHILGRYQIDPDRIYVTGLSMGGYGTWRLAAKYPDRFAAIAPICGGGDPRDAARISHLPIWVFHGAKDQVVDPGESQEMVDALKAVGCAVKLTIYLQAGHDSWTETYENPALYEWFLEQRLPDNK